VGLRKYTSQWVRSFALPHADPSPLSRLTCNLAGRKVVKFYMLPLLRMRLALLAVSSMLTFTNQLCSQVPESHVKIELIPENENTTTQAHKSFWVGLLFRLDPGWHIYWRNPGDAGEPPRVQWELPPGFVSGPILWPQPVRLGTGSVVDYGYENQVLLMASVEAPATPAASSTQEIGADVKYIVCREMCIPGMAHVALSSPASPQQSSAWRQLFEQTTAQIPRSAPGMWKLSAKSDPEYFNLFVRTASRVNAVTFFPLEAGQIDNSAPQGFTSTENGFRLKLKKSDLLVKPVPTLKGLLVFGPDHAFEIAVPVAPR
jgi:DsbC/DsbD-like thiol-disulfide interchange protein